MRTFDGLRLDVRTYGPEDAPLTVLLAHCWTLNQADWHYQVRDLQREFGHRIRIVTWDHRGHGQSDAAPKADCTIENLGRDMGDVIDAYAGPGALVLAGHSIGGMTMMALAEQRPEVYQRVVGAAFVATSSGRLDTVTLGLPEMGPFAKAQIPRILAFRSRTLTQKARRRAPIIERQIVRRFLFGKPMRLVDAALTVEGIINSPAATMVGFYENCMLHERTDALKVLDGVPTHVLVGTRDVLTPPSHGQRIADAVDGAVLTVVPEAGHMLPLERDELVSGVLIRLIRPHL
ncbi:alpha/beta fold hydrolase [Nocardioides marmoriginsengisoli]|uniref:Alpha/beta fold hydrolase n=1 Tax=Nocardioides marmoriginsengisoli TaxID=661483 RepID=A0A3N0CRU2_9ACTN|nr:alpha/beta fold hydrolase [Nocardioides marmoriginsengisoli]RNL66120.1 alpha/beta fold hydrolase [Nocardioides marmoriginsengisoli]